MKERGILFQGAMVRALLADTKTNTRRAMRLPHGLWETSPSGELVPIPVGCPYGTSGERLWVRETFFAFGRWETRFNAKKARDEWHFIDMTLECGKAYLYAADGPRPQPLAGKRDGGVTPKWWKRPAIFMPRAASRILLEVTEVRVERLQDISEADAMAEGITCERIIVGSNCNGGVHQEELGERFFFDGCEDEGFMSATDAYAALWESINGPGSWDANPWVWCVCFRRVS